MINGKLFFSSPCSFNDPNEFRLRFKAPSSILETKSKFFRDNPSATQSDWKDWYRSVDWDNWYSSIEPSLQDDLLSKFSVCCFSTMPQSTAMWGHYANNHTGVCVAFTPAVYDIPDMVACSPVKYSKVLPYADYFTESDEDIIIKTFFNKEHIWKYESEVRLVRSGAAALVTINKNFIHGLIVGLRASPETVEFARTIASEHGIKVFQCVKQPGHYDLAHVAL